MMRACSFCPITFFRTLHISFTKQTFFVEFSNIYTENKTVFSEKMTVCNVATQILFSIITIGKEMTSHTS